MYLTSTNVGHPRLEAWKHPLPGDLKVFKDFIEALRNECKYRRYGDDTIMNPQLLTSVSGEEKSYDNILEFCKNALED